MVAKSLIQLALDTIKNNSRNACVVAAPHGPGHEHKEYLHVWPRDALFVALELQNFNDDFAKKIVENVLSLPTDKGLFYQRYELDGEPDPKAWCNGDGARQLDQDALRFVALARFPGLNVDKKKIKKSYLALLHQIKNKRSSTDVWEQKRGYFFYTTATLIYGLISAERVLEKSEIEHKNILRELIASLDHFYDEKLQSFVKGPTERIIDIEVVIGLNVLFECGLKIFQTKEKLLRALSTLAAVERELCIVVGKSKVPIRYKGDFWNGEFVCNDACGRPWPMGTAMISQAYSFVARTALKIGEYAVAGDAMAHAARWIEYIRSIPNIDHFPEQIDYDGALPKLVPKPLTWCAAEIMKAERLYSETKERLSSYSTIGFIFNIHRQHAPINSALN
jgi:GH15 family glucan-1,4-alpha-glucosidase